MNRQRPPQGGESLDVIVEFLVGHGQKGALGTVTLSDGTKLVESVILSSDELGNPSKASVG